MATLSRHLGTSRAVVIGLTSMIGAGVFYVWAPAADAAGNAMLIALVIAAVIATFNALSTAQLAMVHPVSGGSYAYGRALLGPWWGFTAGWLFMVGKTCSAGAIALIAGSYLWPEQARAVAVAVVVLFAVVNATGIRSTAAVGTVIVTVVLAGLAASLLGVALGQPQHPLAFDLGVDPLGVLRAAALIFFAFAGYARMATLGEEARDPRRTLPRAIVIGLIITLVVYALVGMAVMSALGTADLARSASPLADALDGAWWVRVLAAVACLGSLMSVLAGLSRTGLAMARTRDLPGPLAHISPRTNAPIVAETTVAVFAIAGILLLEPARLVGLSSCAVLCYYAVAHLSALRQPREQRWVPRIVSVLGLIGCVGLASTLPWQAIVGTAAVLAVGFAARGIRLAVDRRVTVADPP